MRGEGEGEGYESAWRLAAPQAGLQWGYLIGLGFFHTAVQYILLYGAFQKLPMALIAILSFIYPVVAVVLDTVLVLEVVVVAMQLSNVLSWYRTIASFR